MKLCRGFSCMATIFRNWWKCRIPCRRLFTTFCCCDWLWAWQTSVCSSK